MYDLVILHRIQNKVFDAELPSSSTRPPCRRDFTLRQGQSYRWQQQKPKPLSAPSFLVAHRPSQFLVLFHSHSRQGPPSDANPPYLACTTTASDREGLTIRDAVSVVIAVVMDPSIQRALNEKLYEKRKIGALEYVLCPMFRVSASASLFPFSSGQNASFSMFFPYS